MNTVQNRAAIISRCWPISYCSRGSGLAALAAVFQQVATGDFVFPRVHDEVRIDIPALTARECDVLLGLDQGQPIKVIAIELGISATTVRGYVQSIFSKLDVHSATAALRAARISGLLYSLDPSHTR
jgi:two-component system response regulator FixJ